MHTVMVLAAGFAILGLCVLFGRIVAGGRAGTAVGALMFLPIWLVAAALNMYAGVATAGYSVADEAPIFLIVFLIPAAVALLIRRMSR